MNLKKLCFFLLLAAPLWADSTFSNNPPYQTGTTIFNGGNNGAGYSRMIRLAHNGSANGRLLGAFEDFDLGAQGIWQSNDDGLTWSASPFATVPDSANGAGWYFEFEPDLYELPQTVGSLAAGTILLAGDTWQASTGAHDILLYKSTDQGQTWQFVSYVDTTPNNNIGGIWEPELFLTSAGNLACIYSDERFHASQNYNQLLAERVSTNGGQTWGAENFIVAINDGNQRPGMGIVVKMPNNQYIMSFEAVGDGASHTHIKFSNDGLTWGSGASDYGIPVTTATGAYTGATPFLQWFPAGGANGVLALTGQFQINTATSERELFFNTDLGQGSWQMMPSPVQWMGNNNGGAGYSQGTLPTADGLGIIHMAGSSNSNNGNKCSMLCGREHWILPGQTYNLMNQKSSLALDIPGNSNTPGTGLELWTLNNAIAQSWTFAAPGDNVWTVTNPGNGLAWDDLGWGTTAGTVIDEWNYNGLAVQQFKLQAVGNGTWKFANVNAGLLMGVSGNAVAPNSAIVLSADSGDLSNNWWVFPPGALTPTPTSTNSPTATRTPTSSPTKTSTPSSTPSFTPTRTNTPIPPTATFTSTPTRSFTPTSTYTSTPTYSFSPTRTNTPIPPTATFSFTSTVTRTFTPSHTFTFTQTLSSTPTKTNTPVPPTTTFTPTSTATRTFTASNSFTFTQTSSFTPSPFNTFTQTPASTPACGKRMLAYYGFYDQYNSIPYNSTKIPYNKLTHIIEDNLTLDCAKADGSLDLVTGAGYVDTNLISSAHAAGVKVLMEVANDFARTCTASTFSTVAASATYRTNFANNVYNFCIANGYDGVDIDWEQPQTSAEGANCTLLIQALRAKMPAPWIISMAIPALPAGWTSYNVPALIGSLDWINVMSYDFNEGTSNYTAHVSPEFQNPADTQNLGSLSTSIDWYIAQGVPASKLNAGMAFYGYQYPSANALWQSCGTCNPSAAPLFYGPDIKPKINAGGWTDHTDASANAHYLLANSGNGFITYDNANSIAAKVNYSLGTRAVGGVFMWELSQDYDGGSQDLLSAMYNAYASQCGGATATPTRTFTAIATATKTFTPVPPTVTFTSTSTMTPTFTRTLSPTPTVTPASTLCQHAALALYEYPNADWTTAKAGYPVYSLGVANPNSGPGAAYDPTYQAAITQAQSSGVTVIGYVHTSYSTRSIATVESEIDLYYSFYPSIDGIFLDEVTNDGTGLSSYYTALYAYIKAKAGKHFVVINPGSQTTEGYMAVCDVVLNFEYDYATYVASYSAPSWVANYPASRFWHIVYSAGSAAQMQNAVTLSRQRNAGYIEVTDQGLPNPYAVLPSYWSSELTAVGAPCLSPTPTNTPAGSSSPTFTPTRSLTPTTSTTASPTKTFTPTSTFTFTAMVTTTPTSSPTPASSASATASSTPTASSTSSWTATPTPITSSTSTGTPSPINTGTSTATLTATASPSPTDTFTGSPTPSFTRTSTFTSTASFTPTFTFSPTKTNTQVPPTATYSSTSIRTLTPTFTLSPILTFTQTPTSTPTRTLTFTSTSTFTFTNTLTSTPTFTFSPFLTFTQTPTSTFTLSPFNTFTRTPTVTYTVTRTFTSTPTIIPNSGSCIGVLAWNGNFVFYATGSKVTYNGELYRVIQPHTSEPNWMPPVVPALWQDLGPCGAVTTAAVLPNPATTSNTVQVAVPLTAPSDVTLEVFTLGFRKVIHRDYPQAAVGTTLPLDLQDDWGGKLANGLYYIFLRAGGHTWKIKLLVLH